MGLKMLSGFVKASIEGENAKEWLLRGYKGR